MPATTFPCPRCGQPCEKCGEVLGPDLRTPADVYQCEVCMDPWTVGETTFDAAYTFLVRDGRAEDVDTSTPTPTPTPS